MGCRRSFDGCESHDRSALRGGRLGDVRKRLQATLPLICMLTLPLLLVMDTRSKGLSTFAFISRDCPVEGPRKRGQVEATGLNHSALCTKESVLCGGIDPGDRLETSDSCRLVLPCTPSISADWSGLSTPRKAVRIRVRRVVKYLSERSGLYQLALRSESIPSRCECQKHTSLPS